jgi:hypothetical protein
MFVDLRPTMRGMIVVASHGIAEQLSRSTRMFPYSVTKSPTMSGIEQLIGKKSLITAEVGNADRPLSKNDGPRSTVYLPLLRIDGG